MGQRVLPRSLGAKFVKNGSEVLAEPGKLYVVDRVQQNKLWVRGQEGWIDGGSVVDSNSAAKFFTEKLYKDPTVENYLSRAQAWAVIGHSDRALTDYEAVLHLNADTAMAHNGKGSCLLRKKDYRGAIDAYAKAIQVDPDYAAAHNNLGNALRSVGQYQNALGHYETANKLQPGVVPSLFGLGVCHLAIQQYDQAISVFDEVVAIQPDHADALNERGLAWQRKGDFLRAIASYTSSVDADANNYHALNNLAWLLANCSQKELRLPKRAVELASNACKVTEYNNWYCLGTLAAAYARNRQFASAVKVQKRALRVMPTNVAEPDRRDYEKRLKIYSMSRKAS